MNYSVNLVQFLGCTVASNFHRLSFFFPIIDMTIQLVRNYFSISHVSSLYHELILSAVFIHSYHIFASESPLSKKICNSTMENDVQSLFIGNVV